MTDVVVRHYDRLDNTPALVLATLGWLDAQQRGLGENVSNVYTGSLEAFVGFVKADRDEVAVGVTTFQHAKSTGVINIYQSYVLEPYRGIGVYRALWESVVQKALELKVPKIVSATHFNNTTMRAIAKRQGRVEESVGLVFHVPLSEV